MKKKKDLKEMKLIFLHTKKLSKDDKFLFFEMENTAEHCTK